MSAALRELETSAQVFSSDEAVHAILEEPLVLKTLVSEFGSKILGADEKVNRSVLRELAFGSEKVRKKLESILHPRVFSSLENLQKTLSEQGNTQLLIAEIPLYYETQKDYPADLVVLVAISPTLQRQRMVGTRGLSTEVADRILNAQLPLSRKLELADKIVWNEGDPALLKLQAQLLLNQ